MSEQIKWNEVADRAKKMTSLELSYAYLDAVKTAQTIGRTEMIGKDQGYYMDEASIYWAEMKSRDDSSSVRFFSLAKTVGFFGAIDNELDEFFQ